jgi:hypothetical protein
VIGIDEGSCPAAVDWLLVAGWLIECSICGGLLNLTKYASIHGQQPFHRREVEGKGVKAQRFRRAISDGERDLRLETVFEANNATAAEMRLVSNIDQRQCLTEEWMARINNGH